MKNIRAGLFALIFAGVIFFLLSQPKAQSSPQLGWSSIPFIAVLLVWAGWKIFQLRKKLKPSS